MEVYACYNTNEDIRNQSSSGGIYALIAQAVIKNNGAVFAVCYDDKFETEHRKITSIEELNQTFGSKYVPSKLHGTFQEVKNCLIEGQTVLFVGTPCQCAGLKCFLGQEYENLWLIDLVCHGVPSKAVWRQYLKELEDDQIISINMRDKSLGWSEWNYNWSIKYKNGDTKIIHRSQVLFMQGFEKDYYLRPSCYECNFKGLNRCTDITIGDYWGVWKEDPNMDDGKGTSIIIIHSEKGRMIMESIKKNIKIIKTDIHKVIEYNPSIIESAMLTTKRKLFFKKFKSNKTLKHIIKDLSKTDIRVKLKNKFKNIILKLSTQSN